jgi:2-keto-3-deoxy-6-phosphogluconate aldolase
MITQFMLTKDDVTIPDAFAVYGEVAASFTAEQLPYVGFKNIGHPLDKLTELGRTIVKDGRKLVLEIVGASAETERQAAELALEVGAELLIGGTHTSDVLDVIAGSGLAYYPTVGDVNTEPGRLHGDLGAIVDECRRLAGTDGVNGVMLLGYRYVGDVTALLTAVSAVPSLQVVNAGSVDSSERIRQLADLGVWAFTIGSAVLDLSLPAGGSLEDQLRWVLDTAR